MSKNKIIGLLVWVIVLLWVYAKDRMTKEEYIHRKSEKLRNDPEWIAMRRHWEEEMAADPKLREYYVMETYESALYDIDMEHFGE